MAVDIDYHRRLDWLAELMLISPTSRMKRLQREALKYYPLASVEAIRNWMSWRTAFAAADIADLKSKERQNAQSRKEPAMQSL